MKQEHFVKFVNEFYGYGEWTTPDWFLGIEEGGGGNIEHVNQKLSQFYFWTNIQDGLVDNFEFQSLLDECRDGRFLTTINNGPAAQTTWIHPLKSLILKRRGIWPADLNAVKLAQLTNLGRQNSRELNSTWIELFPLPNPGISEYPRWNQWTSHFSNDWIMPFDRLEYEKLFINIRIEFLRRKLEQFRPKNIIAYIGTNNVYHNYLSRLIPNIPVQWTIDNPLPRKDILYFDILWDTNNSTRIFRCYHPSRTNDYIYWQRVGELMI
jgi:hypothetical protein